jgi:hypothetical protein
LVEDPFDIGAQCCDLVDVEYAVDDDVSVTLEALRGGGYRFGSEGQVSR